MDWFILTLLLSTWAIGWGVLDGLYAKVRTLERELYSLGLKQKSNESGVKYANERITLACRTSADMRQALYDYLKVKLVDVKAGYKVEKLGGKKRGN